MWAAFDKKLTKDGFAPNHAPVFLHIFYAIERVTHASRFGCVSLQGFAYSPIPMQWSLSSALTSIPKRGSASIFSMHSSI